MRPTSLVCISFVLAASTVAVCDAATLLVPANYPTIQAAISAASNGDVVIVAPGTYTGAGNWDLKTNGKKITVRSAAGPATCTIDCAFQHRGFAFSSSETTDTVVDGFTIRKGVGGGTEGGGGISVFLAAPTVRNCVITECAAVGFSNGGGMGIFFGNPVIEHCVFANNSGGKSGGGIEIVGQSNPTIRDCIFSANTCSNADGGGIDIGLGGKATVVGCTFVGNTDTAFFSVSDGVCTIVNCLFSGNEANQFGVGGVSIYSTPSQIINCTFTGNVGTAVGKKVTIVNSILADSVSSTGEPLVGQVSGIPNDINISFSDVENGWSGPGSNNISADPQFPQLASGTWTLAPFYDTSANLTVYTDTNAAFVPGALVGRVMNPDTAQQRRQYIAANTATTISVYGNFTPDNGMGTSNLLVDVNDAYAIFDVRPVAGSPVIDAGKNAAVPNGVVVDLDGHARFVDDPSAIDSGLGRGPLVDMGAFERQVPGSADLNGDGAVNATDLGILLGAWGSSDPVADIDGDGVVGATDLGMLVGAWTG